MRGSFRHATVLTIAHRMHSLADSDRVMVLSAGAVAEFAPPAELLASAGSLYRGLLEETIRTAAAVVEGGGQTAAQGTGSVTAAAAAGAPQQQPSLL